MKTIKRGRGVTSAAAVAAFALLATAAPAAATGGASIATAPTVPYGAQQFGNTVTDDGHAPNCDSTIGPGRSWWLLPVTTGDKVTIDIEGQTEGDGFTVNVYKSGTNDFNYASQFDPYATNANGSSAFSDQFELPFIAPSSGLMPMDVSTCDSIGSYDFTAYVAHKLVLGLNPAGTKRRQHRSLFGVQLHNPDGVAVSSSGIKAAVQVLTHGHWTTLGTVGSPYRFSIKWALKLRGHFQSVRVVVSGAGYQTTTSRTLRVKAF